MDDPKNLLLVTAQSTAYVPHIAFLAHPKTHYIITIPLERSWRESAIYPVRFHAPLTKHYYTRLSAHLYQHTNQPQYLSNATLSANFIINNLYSGDNGTILDSINLSDCQLSGSGTTADAGLTIDGLSVLAQLGETVGGTDGNPNYSSL